MFIIIGIIIVLGSIITGFLMINGPLYVLVQPSEYIVIGGAALGATLAANPLKLLTNTLGKLMGAIKGSPYNKAAYFELLQMQYDVYVNLKKGGVLSLEEDVNNPMSSGIFTKYKSFIGNHHAVDFFCDALKMIVNGACDAEELEIMLDTEIDTHHDENAFAPAIVNRVSDAMPGLGIVAAVLGIVVTMQHLDGPPEELGHHVGAALIGTFLGLLLAYGILSPIAAHIENLAQDEAQYFLCMKQGLVAYANDSAPSTAVEFARKTIFSFDRPSSNEIDEALRSIKPR
ncbi:MAG: flagellar motor stator protein MotA [Pyrinomonadaceae bacterium]|nr:flagellar motor stator protein MotA [Pyrinomonadaceae bacterium]